MGWLIAQLVAALLCFLLVVAAIWFFLETWPVLGIVLLALVILGALAGGTEVLSDIGGLILGEVCINAIALRLTPSRVESSRLLQFFFYVDTDTLIAGDGTSRDRH